MWELWMRRALALAALAEGHTSPNPLVGAVVLDREGRLAGEGFHLPGPEMPMPRWEPCGKPVMRPGVEPLLSPLNPAATTAARPPAVRRCCAREFAAL